MPEHPGSDAPSGSGPLHPGPRDRSASPLSRWGPFCLIAASAGFMLLWSWNRWVDVVVDFGRELYAAWRLSQGGVLYTDIAWFNGPLSPYWNALVFKILGAGVHNLILSNLCVTGLILFLLFRICLYLSDRFSATLACLVFIMLFAFAVTLQLGNYSYIAPYSHEMTHGVLLCLAALSLHIRYLQTGRNAWFFGVGLCAGLAALTKMEICAAALAGALAALMLSLTDPGPENNGRMKRIACYAAGLLTPPLAAFILLAQAMPAPEALQGALSAFTAFGRGELLNLPFYRENMGVAMPWESAKAIFGVTVFYAVVFGPCLGAALLFRKDSAVRSILAVLVMAPALAVVSRPHFGYNFGGLMAKPYVLFMPALALFWMWKRRTAGDAETRRILTARVVFCLFSWVMLGKIMFNAALSHYGFGLAMPATMAVIMAACGWIPGWVQRRGGSRTLFRAAAVCVLVIAGAEYISLMDSVLATRFIQVGENRDAMIWDRRANGYKRFLEIIGETIAPDQTLAVMPSGVMANYLSRRVNPTKYIVMIPPELTMFGEQNIVDAYEASPPDYIVFMHNDNREYGFQYFGRDYGQALHQWVIQHYEPIGRLGSMPFRKAHGGYLFFKRANCKT